MNKPVVILICLCLLGNGIYQVYQNQKQSSSWVTTTANVDSVRIEKQQLELNESSADERTVAVLKYRFQSNGHEYTGETEINDVAPAIAQTKYSKGQSVEIAYDQDNPVQSNLKSKINSNQEGLLGWAGIVIGGIGLLACSLIRGKSSSS